MYNNDGKFTLHFSGADVIKISKNIDNITFNWRWMFDMLDLNEIAIFIQVVQNGSFIKASRKLGVPHSTVSFKVASLEKRLGMALLHRTTRKLSVTSAGESFFNRCLLGLNEIQSAEEELAFSVAEPRGTLRITAPLELSLSKLNQAVSEYTERFSKVSVEVFYSDRVVDLLGEGFDLAIRAGNLRDSTLKIKKLGDVFFILVSTREYIKSSGQLEHPRDLSDHSCIHFSPFAGKQWALVNQKTHIQVPIPSRISLNDLSAIRQMVLAGKGVALLPYHLCAEDLREKRLVQVLSDWRTKGTPIHFVYVPNKYLSLNLKSFMQTSEGHLKKIFARV